MFEIFIYLGSLANKLDKYDYIGLSSTDSLSVLFFLAQLEAKKSEILFIFTRFLNDQNVSYIDACILTGVKVKVYTWSSVRDCYRKNTMYSLNN